MQCTHRSTTYHVGLLFLEMDKYMICHIMAFTRYAGCPYLTYFARSIMYCNNIQTQGELTFYICGLFSYTHSSLGEIQPWDSHVPNPNQYNLKFRANLTHFSRGPCSTVGQANRGQLKSHSSTPLIFLVIPLRERRGVRGRCGLWLPARLRGVRIGAGAFSLSNKASTGLP